MDEKLVYTGLLKGANIGNVEYSDLYAETASIFLKSGNFNVEKIDEIHTKIITKYGVILEEDEEKSFYQIIKARDLKGIIEFLENLEKTYRLYFIELISERRKKVERIFEEINQRTKIYLKDDEITDIKKAESHENFFKIVEVYRYIQLLEVKNINLLYKETYNSVYHHIQNNMGDNSDADETWIIAQTEFNNKLRKEPGISGYYEWRPIKVENSDKASLKTYFVKICKMRWLDELRRRKVRASTSIEEFGFGTFSQDSINDFYEKLDLKYKMKSAINKLDKTCKAIIEGKYFGGEFEDGMENNDLAKEINLSVGHIKNMHKNCLEELGELYRKEKLN